MARPRFKNLPEEKRLALIETAGREFAQKGYDGASLNFILQKAGYSKGAAYYYFDNKADLFATAVEHYTQMLDQTVGEMSTYFNNATAGDFWERFASLAETSLRKNGEASLILGLLKTAWYQSAEARETVDLTRFFTLREQIMKAMLSRGRTVGAVRTDVPEDLLLQVVIGLDDAFDEWLRMHPEVNSSALNEFVLKLMPAMKAMLEPPQVAKRKITKRGKRKTSGGRR